jgi:hypothetical protein
MKKSPFFLGIAVGTMMGAALGLVFAPLSGRNLRRIFKRKIRLLNFFDELSIRPNDLPILQKFTPWKGDNKATPEQK